MELSATRTGILRSRIWSMLVMPDAVVDTPECKAMSYPAVTGLLVSAVNELSDKIEKKGKKHGRAA